MVSRARNAVPNDVLHNLRDAAGQTQQDVADAINRLAVHRKRGGVITANQVSRWERGVTYPSPLHRQLLAEHFGVSLEQLGLTRPRMIVPAIGTREPGVEAFSLQEDGQMAPGPDVERSQAQWRAVRRGLNQHRAHLAREAARLYDPSVRVGETGLLAAPEWLPRSPVELRDLRITRSPDVPEPEILGTEDAAAKTWPLSGDGRRHQRYSLALRDVEQPRLLENRLAWRLTGVGWSARDSTLSFGIGTYFSGLDIGETLAHEMAASHLMGDGGGTRPATWRGLAFRRLLGDPLSLLRTPVIASVDTLTLRRDEDGVSFVLHNRSSGRVAVAGGMLHIMPSGVFQPSSVLPAAQLADFDLWRNMVREYSEEFLGNAEHGGEGEPADFDAPPLAALQRAYADGEVRAFCLGVARDALTLWGEILTVAVFDGPAYDRLFADMVRVNDEGAVVQTGRTKPTSALPFTRQVIEDLLAGGRLAPAAAGCLELAWQHRRAILDRS
ncbi:helix-turn-helix transcriptional regulator [Micromonospora sp. NPDC049559]|uniref:helix-turn-helix transcriptional regulator n=1 Tax=Micromonospora sp. NPDC049559 TaxID=3155923 RepID=UPI0034174284